MYGSHVFTWLFKTLSSNVPCRTLAVVTHRVTEGLTCGLGHLCSNPSKMDCEIAPAQLTALANYLFWYTKASWNWRWNLFSTNLGWLTLPTVLYSSLELTTHSISNHVFIMCIWSLLTLIGMRGDTFISLSFLDQILSAEFSYQKFSKLFLR